MKTMSLVLVLIVNIFIAKDVIGNEHTRMPHEMQHGFIISDDDDFFSHLVAPKHHSHQLSLTGTLKIDESEVEFYNERKMINAESKGSYFLFQAQKLDLPSTHDGQILSGHIIESPKGDYTPKNIIIKNAKIRVEKVHINMVNPFFTE